MTLALDLITSHSLQHYSNAATVANNEWLAKVKQEEEEREAEWAKKYRDRVSGFHDDDVRVWSSPPLGQRA